MCQYRHKGHTTHLNNWLKSLKKDPEMKIIAKVEEDHASQAERFWIACFRLAKARLINFTDGGEDAFRMEITDARKAGIERQRLSITGRKQSPETIAKRAASFKAARAAGLHKDNGCSERFRALNKSRRGRKHSPEHVAKLKALYTPERRAEWADRRRAQGTIPHHSGPMGPRKPYKGRTSYSSGYSPVPIPVLS